MENSSKGQLARKPPTNWLQAFCLVTMGVCLAAGGIYVGDTDDAPGAALLGIALMIVLVSLGVKRARRGR